jgi:hypothetical protein
MSFRSKLLGTWILLSAKLVNEEGDGGGYPFGDDAEGRILYTNDGYMTGMIFSQKVKRWVGGFNAPSSEEAQVLAQYATFYQGKFYLDEKPGNSQDVYHEIHLGVPPNLMGATQKRPMELREEDGALRMTIRPEGEVNMNGCRGLFVLEWRKAEANSTTSPSTNIQRLGDVK